jgi:hypothetical protein
MTIVECMRLKKSKMSMRNAMRGMCPKDISPKPFNEIQNSNPPYGTGSQQNKDLRVDRLIEKLLGNAPFNEIIDHIDVWGEGRILEVKTGICTGFQTSFNINLNQGITLKGYEYYGYAIPNLLPVCNYDDTFDVIPDKSVKTVTTMGAPIHPIIAKEISRIVADSGVVITFGYDCNAEQVVCLENALQKRGFSINSNYKLDDNYKAVKLEPIIVFSSTKNTEPNIADL